MKTEIQKLNIGDKFTIRKNGKIYEYLGFCPIDDMPCASADSKIEYFEPTDLVRPVIYNQ